jgi:hypothetical protein
VILPALSKSSALGFLLKGGVPGRGIEPGTAVQQSSAPSTKPRCTLNKHINFYAKFRTIRQFSNSDSTFFRNHELLQLFQ